MARSTRHGCVRAVLPSGTAVGLLVTAASSFSAAAAMAADCEALMTLALPHTEITLAETVAAGTLRVEGFRAAATNAVLDTLPAFCRVVATSRPTAGSEIGIEVWLPRDGWNGKLQSVGNGAWAGSISLPALATAVAAGYAAASTDTGHRGGSVEFAIGHPEKLVDFAHRAVHEMTVAAKAIVAAHYGRPAGRAYFAGCSTGGRQAMTEAQRYPGDYDGIVAGAPAYYPTHLQGAQVWTAAIAHRTPDAAVGPRELALVNDAVVAACDTLDRVADGVLEDPRACGFDPGTLVCGAGRTTDCLSPAQAETFAKTYAGPTTSRGESLFPGLARGSELGWSTLSGDAPLGLADDTYRYLVFDDPDWDYRTLEPERDFALAAERIGPLMNAIDPNLEPFLAGGGKLLLYHGWSDPGITPFATVRYYAGVIAALGPDRAGDGVRLFMVPGMNHCGGGVGTDTFDAVAALDRWIETGTAPARIEASRVVDGETVRTRPLCPFPQIAQYTGSGSTDDAASFVCRERAQGGAR